MKIIYGSQRIDGDQKGDNVVVRNGHLFYLLT